jgi:TM2 domain-containing membrane protein YozV
MGTNASISSSSFWTEGANKFEPKKDEDEEPDHKYAKNLSYDVYVLLVLLGGFLGLDHFYLRSPLTGLAKIVVNVFFFGLWFYYDVFQVFSNKEMIKTYGLSVPVYGASGIAAGVLTKKKPDTKHMRFFMYSAALLFGGIFGADSFVLGDTYSGALRLLLTITGIFAPISLLWWGYNLFLYFVYPSDVIYANAEFFGVPPKPSISAQLMAKYPGVFSWITDYIFGPFKVGYDGFLGSILTAGESAKVGLTTFGIGMKSMGDAAKELFSSLALFANIIANVPKGVGAAVDKSAALQGGGGEQNNLNILGYLLIITIAVISSTGLGLSAYRIFKNDNKTQQKDDAPPEPGILRKSA